MAKGFSGGKNRGGGKGGKSSGGGKSESGGSSASSGGKSRGGPNSGSGAGSRGSGGGKSAGGGSNSEENSRSGSGGKNGTRKGSNIKNARSLADVLSGGKSRPAASGSGSGSEDRRHSFNRERAGGDATDERSSFNPDPAGGKGTQSKKLTYIMQFQPREENNSERSSERGSRDPIAAKGESSRPSALSGPTKSRFDQNPTKKASPSREKFLAKGERGSERSEHSQRPEKTDRSDRPARGERSTTQRQAPAKPSVQFKESNQRPVGSWPQNRVETKQADEPETRRGRGGRPDARRITGLIKRHPDGFGFLIPDKTDAQSELPDIYVARQSMTGIMTNDKVEVELYIPRSGGKPRGGSKGGKPGAGTSSKDERLSGEVTRVLSRANTRVVGRFLPVDKKYGILQDENRGWGADLRIATEDSLNAKEGELIAVEITQYPEDDKQFSGKVVTVIGDSDDPINDVIRVVHQSGIPNEFSAQAVADAAKFGGKVTDEERRGREDLTGKSLITIDGVTAKDFDDAIFTEQTPQGFHLIVGIADVSHYVKPGSRLDEEAYERGTSTYFPNYVVPMLPEELSNELCSLKPHVPRLCFCCEMNIDFEGNVKDYRFFEGVMESKARVTYGEAQEVIDAYANGEERTNKAAVKLAGVAENILRSADLARILMQKRFRDGSLDLEIPETQVVVDSTGESTDIIRASRLFAHRLIEELMLVTNICTARFMDNAQIPGIYRVHEEPDTDNVQNLQRFLFNFGGGKFSGGGKLAKKLTSALESMEGKPEAQILNILTLRTMKQAQYSENNVGHFGLGFSHYSHFTSPIRRYPDLIAHRIIKSQLYDKYHGMKMQEEELASATTWLSSTEQRSTKAERKVISIKKARFIRRFIGEEFEGMVSSVAKFGVFVLLRQYDVDGLVKIEKLGNDRFEFDEENLRLVGRRSGLQYTIGDMVKVKVMSADTETGKVDFELTEFPEPQEISSDERDSDHDLSESSNERGQRGDKGQRKAKSSSARKEPKKSETGRRGSEPDKRGKSPNDRSGVRKERVSKRRGKN